MSTIKSFCTSNRKEILQALIPFNEHVMENKERFKKVIKERDFELGEDGYVRWSPVLVSKSVKKMDIITNQKIENINLINKCKIFMDKIEDESVNFKLNIIEYVDGFQVDLLAEKNKDNLLDSVSYFIWRSY